MYLRNKELVGTTVVVIGGLLAGCANGAEVTAQAPATATAEPQRVNASNLNALEGGDRSRLSDDLNNLDLKCKAVLPESFIPGSAQIIEFEKNGLKEQISLCNVDDEQGKRTVVATRRQLDSSGNYVMGDEIEVFEDLVMDEMNGENHYGYVDANEVSHTLLVFRGGKLVRTFGVDELAINVTGGQDEIDFFGVPKSVGAEPPSTNVPATEVPATPATDPTKPPEEEAPVENQINIDKVIDWTNLSEETKKEAVDKIMERVELFKSGGVITQEQLNEKGFLSVGMNNADVRLGVVEATVTDVRYQTVPLALISKSERGWDGVDRDVIYLIAGSENAEGERVVVILKDSSSNFFLSSFINHVIPVAANEFMSSSVNPGDIQRFEDIDKFLAEVEKDIGSPVTIQVDLATTVSFEQFLEYQRAFGVAAEESVLRQIYENYLLAMAKNVLKVKSSRIETESSGNYDDVVEDQFPDTEFPVDESLFISSSGDIVQELEGTDPGYWSTVYRKK